MNIKILDERTNSDMELNNVINDEVTIVIGKDGGVLIKGSPSTTIAFDPSRWSEYHKTVYPHPIYPVSPFVVQDCVSRA